MPESIPKFAALKIGGFAAWEPQMVAYLRFKGWFTVVNDKYKRPVATDPDAPTLKEQEDIDWWDDTDERAAGAITLALSSEEVIALRDHLESSVALWKEIKKRHVVDKATSRYNAWHEFFNLRIQPGETLDTFAGRAQEVMHHVQERRPTTGYDIATQDGELVVNAVLRGMVEDKSCRTLLTTLLGDATKLGDIAKLRERLVAEDISRDTTPDLYGLKKSDHGVLMASTAPTTTAGAGAATTQNKDGKPKKDRAICAYEGCGGRHTTDSCYKKIIANLKNRLDDTTGAAGNKLVRFNTNAHSTSSATTAAALSANAGSLTMARAAQLPSFDNVADGLWIADTSATAHMTPHRVFFVTYNGDRTH